MWVNNGIYYRIEVVSVSYRTQQMAIEYIGYTNANLTNPIKTNIYLTPVKEFKKESDLEMIVHTHQIDSKGSAK